MISKFFERDEFIINEKVEFMTFSNKYKVLDTDGNQIGFIEQKVPGWHKALRFIINKKMMPFHYEIENSEEQVEVIVKRGWSIFLSTIQITDAEGRILGYIKQKFSMLKPRFDILDSEKNKIGMIKGNWTAWNFNIYNKEEQEIGTINKKWSGAMKEIFTSADNYLVKINPDVAEDAHKVNILSAAITIDMVLKEN